MSRRVALLAGGLVVVAVAAVALVGRGGDEPAAEAATETTTATVQRTDVVQREELDGTLGFRELDAPLTAARAGTVTALPEAGTTVPVGGVLLELDGDPVVLLRGERSAWRDLVEGMAGDDVRQLEASLVELGHGTWDALVDDGRFGAATAAALRSLQAAIGADPTGVLRLGDGVFAPTDVRVGDAEVAVGASVTAGAAVAAATSTEQVVTVALGAAQRDRVEAGDAVEVELPSGDVVPGTVEHVSSVATEGEEGQDPTYEVRIALDDPSSAGGTEQAPVDVSVETARAEDVLAVPVRALVALAEGGYGVEVVGTGGRTRLVAVDTGMFSDSEDLVEVSGDGLRAGSTVVVAP